MHAMDETRIEGPSIEVTALIALCLEEYVGDQRATLQLTMKIYRRLADRGYVVRHLDRDLVLVPDFDDHDDYDEDHD